MKVQILNLDELSGKSWFKPAIPVSRPAMVREPSTSVDGISTARLLCGGDLSQVVTVRKPQRYTAEPISQAVVDDIRMAGGNIDAARLRDISGAAVRRVTTTSIMVDVESACAQSGVTISSPS